MENLIIFVILIALGYFAGHIAERNHYKSIKAREKDTLNLPAVTIAKNAIPEGEIESCGLVHGSVVISIDYFKRILAALRNVFGGEVTSYESLVDRARREAVLRMKEMSGGADIIVNVRIETASIGKNANRKKSLGSVEAIAYGTAVSLRKV
jgi:uncharacterized protein YbjQ (UPF0145 family)